MNQGEIILETPSRLKTEKEEDVANSESGDSDGRRGQSYSGKGERGPYVTGTRANVPGMDQKMSPTARKVVSKVKAAIASVSALHEHARKTAERRSRTFLRCEKCASMTGMCDNCRRIFITGKWRDVHHEWGAEHRAKEDVVQSPSSAKAPGLDRRAAADIKLEEDEEGSSALYPGIYGRSLGRVPSFQEELLQHVQQPTELERVRNEKARLQVALAAAHKREAFLLEQLDGYKRALRFARNFIESERPQPTPKTSAASGGTRFGTATTAGGRTGGEGAGPQIKLQRLVNVYRQQLARLTSDNQRLAHALETSVSSSAPEELRAISRHDGTPTSAWNSKAEATLNFGEPLSWNYGRH